MSTVRDRFFAIPKLPTEPCNLPGFEPGELRVRGMTAGERDRFETSWPKNEDGSVRIEKARAKLVVACVVDASGACVFTEDDIDRIDAMDAAVIAPIAQVARKLSGLDAEAVEEAVKN